MCGELLILGKSAIRHTQAYALRDTSDGKIATAKNPRKWPNLFQYRAALIGAMTDETDYFRLADDPFGMRRELKSHHGSNSSSRNDGVCCCPLWAIYSRIPSKSRFSERM